MGDVAIRVEALGKQYRIGAPKQKYKTLRDSLAGAFVGPARFLRRAGTQNGRGGMIWALRDVSFDVKPGEVVGVIGRNGAGKSTLLKVLSRITEPTEGEVDIYGRVGSLLEVGTGFHLELSGRENTYLNGAILGMRKSEIDRRFDEIVAFAEVEKFIDTPVKHYSSGMYLRLAFAVAAHLEPEILLVDEVLAVGDAAFQKKCLGKMGDVAREGRTVLFVSHNMAAVRSLCSRGIVIDEGRLVLSGDVTTAIRVHQDSQAARQSETPTASYGKRLVFTDMSVGADGSGSISSGDPLQVQCTIVNNGPLPGFNLYCIIEDGMGAVLTHALLDSDSLPEVKEPGVYRISAGFPALWLRPGIYSVYFRLTANLLGAGTGRFASEHVPLDVTGDAPGAALSGMLTPDVDWRLLSRGEPSRVDQ